MIFTPYTDESNVINMIHKYSSKEYALLRMTFTMIDKNNLDANGILRDVLSEYGLVDYEKMDHGGQYGISYDALFVQSDKTDVLKLKFYRVANKRGDRRFSIEAIKRRMNEQKINVGDLLYISVLKDTNGKPQIYIINLTHNTPSEEEIARVLGIDETTQLLNMLKAKLREIVKGGFYNNSKGKGKIDPKDVGDTLEELLGVKTNNRNDADCDGLIEIKAKGQGRTLDTLFTLRPHFEGTQVADFEPIDRFRVSAFARLYGYYSLKHPDCKSLYITIGSEEAPQNNQGFYLNVDDEHSKVNLMWINPKNNKKEIAAYWLFEELKKQLYLKHPSTLWVKAESREIDGMVQFKYNEIEISRAPKFTTFIYLIKTGKITYDWRGYTTVEGKYAGKNHGNAWRIKPNAKTELFGTIEKLDL